MSSNSQVWKKVLLAGGLLLVLVYGLVQIPEVRGRSPESLWKIKIQQLRRDCSIIENKLKSANDTLESLNDFQGKTPSLKSWDDKLRLVQKDCFSVEARVRYRDAKLAALKVAMENRISGASPAAAELNRLLDQVKELQVQGLQYSLGLESTRKRLQTAKLARAAPK